MELSGIGFCTIETEQSQEANRHSSSAYINLYDQPPAQEVIEHQPDLSMSDVVPLEHRYKASMVLSGAGDALGYNHGNWEFENDGVFIHEEVQKRGGLEKLDAIDFPVSDDTVMHLATAEALVKVGEGEGASLPVLYRALVEKYIVSMTDMNGRGAEVIEHQPDLSMSDVVPLEHRYKASMVLSGAGDALGYNHGNWEFENDGVFIHEEVQKRGGLEKLDAIDFPVSDDTVMHLATAEALVKVGEGEGASLPVLYRALVEKYIVSMTDMNGRGAGLTCINSVARHRRRTDMDINIPFNKRGGGCGAAMRAMCIGLRFPDPEQEHLLIAVSVESGRLTHHHPTGYLGALAAALFTAYAVRGTLPVEAWGHGLMEVLDKAKEYVKHSGDCVEQNMDYWDYFGNQWGAYLEKRGILDGKSKPQFPESYGVKERECFYKAVSFMGMGGASGHDAPMIAYDALLRAGDSWVELANHGFFHGGDSDSTAVIAAAWWGALFGFRGVPEINYQRLEYRDRLSKLGQQLYELRGKPLGSEKV